VEVASELAWVDSLRQQTDIHIPEPLANLQGERVGRVGVAGGGRLAVLLERAPGHNIDLADATAQRYREIGGITAQMHLHTLSWQKPAWFSRFAWLVPQILGPAARFGYWGAYPGLEQDELALLRRAAQRLEGRLGDYVAGGGEVDLIHGDLHVLNVMVDHADTWVLDFDDSGISWLMFDIGAAGPFAGFLFAVPALFIGTALSPIVRLPENTGDLMTLGDPLLVKAAAWLTWGTIRDGYSLNMHPMLFASWFGLLATALNLFPIGQLDGGHITYAVFGRRSSMVTVGSIFLAIGLTFLSRSWLVWTVLLIAMTLAMGPHHPRTVDEEVPLDKMRLWLAFAALIMLIVCFTYNPIQLPE